MPRSRKLDYPLSHKSHQNEKPPEPDGFFFLSATGTVHPKRYPSPDTAERTTAASVSYFFHKASVNQFWSRSDCRFS